MEFAHPIEIVKVNDTDHSFSLNESSLNQVLLQDDIKDRSVVVVSVAGAFRKGKSFLLDFFLRFLYAKYRKNDVSNWLGKDDEPLKGFTWRGGSQRITTGILMWSDIFTLDYKNGDKIAIILLDTQGTFDIGSTVRDCSLIFALSTLLSSVQCYNLMSNIQEDDLMNLNLFTEFGRLAREDNGNTPFQRLQFIVRDWSFPYEHEYGSNGGQTFLEGLLEVKSNLKPESKMLRQQIRNCFNEIECFMMPHPGSIVATNSRFDGSLRNIDEQFKDCLKKLTPMLLAPENLVVKKINGQLVKARELIPFMKTCFVTLQSEERIIPQSIYMALAEQQNMKAVDEAKAAYNRSMKESCGGMLSLDENDLKSSQRSSEQIAILKFETTPKMGNEEFCNNFLSKLQSDLKELFVPFKERNDTKRQIEELTKALAATVGTIGAVALGRFGLSKLGSIFQLFRNNK